MNKTINIIFKNMDGTLKRRERFEYNQTTTVKDFIEYYSFDTNDLTCLWFITNSKSDYSKLLIDFCDINGKMDWMVPVDQCLFKDLLQTHNIREINIEYSQRGASIGPLSGIKVVLRVLNFMWDNRDVIELTASTIDLVLNFNALKNWVEERFLVKGESSSSLLNSLTYKSHTSKSDFKFEYEIEDDDFAEAALYFLGYLYDGKTDLYFHNGELMLSHIKELNDIYFRMNNEENEI